MAQLTQENPQTKVNLLDVGGPCVVDLEGIPGVVFVAGPAVCGVVLIGIPGVVTCVDFVVVGIPGVVTRVVCVVAGIPGVVTRVACVVAGIPGVVMSVDFAVVVCFCQ